MGFLKKKRFFSKKNGWESVKRLKNKAFDAKIFFENFSKMPTYQHVFHKLAPVERSFVIKYFFVF